MANVMLKSVKFARILNGRLSFSSMKSYYANGRYIVQSYKQTKQTKAYATAAYGLKSNEDVAVKNNAEVPTMITKDIESIDKALFKIDSAIRQTGRVQMKIVYQAFSSITSKEMTSSTHGLYLIRCCKHCGDEPPSKRIELVNQIWNTYQELGIEFDVRHYNALLDVHISNGLDFNPADILTSMEEDNIQPNKTTYLMIMKKYCQDGNISGASEILQHMKKEGLSADEKVFNYLIEGHIKNSDFAGAKDIIEVMKSSNLKPNADTHTVFACGYAALGEKDEMIASLKECGEESTAENYLKVVDVLATSGYKQYIDEVLSLIRDKESYAQDFINAAVQLIHNNHIDVGYKLTVAACSRDYNESTNIFIKQLMKVGRPISEILPYCQRIIEDGLNPNIYFIAASIASENGQIDYALPLLQKMLQTGRYVRPSNFWPLLRSAKQKKSVNDVWLILKKMSELGVPADMTTYLEVVYPLFGVPKPEYILQNVRESNQVPEVAADALFAYYCNLGEINYANHLVQMIPVTVKFKLDTEAFVSNTMNLNKDDYNEFLKLLKYMFMDMDKNVDHSAFQGRLLKDLLLNRTSVLEALLRKYPDLSFNERALYLLEKEIMQKTSSYLPIVRKLKSMSSERESLFGKENMSVKEEKICLDHLQAQNVSCGPFLIRRIFYHIKNKNISRVSELLSLFEEMKLTYSPLLLSNLMTMYCDAGEVEKARNAANKLITEFPSFKLDVIRLLDYVNFLVKYEKFDESYETLKNLLKEPYNYNNRDGVWRSIRRLGMTFSECRDVEFVEKMQKLLMPLAEEVGTKRVLLEPLVNHLLKKDFASGLEEFKNIVNKHQIPVCLNQILIKCIALEDKSTLQKVIDLASNCIGKSYALLELAVAFIETSNTQKAARMIENLGKEIRPKDLNDICLKLTHQKKYAELEQLILITKPLNHVDREELYIYAFRACANRNDIGRAKKLFNILKQEIPELKPETLKFVEDIISEQNKPVPETQFTQTTATTESITAATEATKPFIEQLEAGNAEAALSELNALKKGYIRCLSLNTLTDLIDLCLQKNCTNDLSLNVQAMSYIIDNVKDVLKPILEKYSAAGDVEKFIDITLFIPDFSLMSINFNAYFSKAYINSGKHEELLMQLEQRVEKKNKFFTTVAFEELLKFPEYEDRVFNLAVRYLDSNYPAPIAVLWSLYFIKENFEKANEIYEKYTVPIDKTDMVINHARKHENVAVALKYVDFIKDLSIRARIKERAYGAALELLVSKGMYDEAVALVVESEKRNLLLHKLYLTPLRTLKNALEKENKPVPFSLPLDRASDSSSDSE